MPLGTVMQTASPSCLSPLKAPLTSMLWWLNRMLCSWWPVTGRVPAVLQYAAWHVQHVMDLMTCTFMLQPALFGGRTDGKGQSLVYYFTLPEGWEPDHVQNKNALHLLERFMADGHEADGYACCPG